MNGRLENNINQVFNGLKLTSKVIGIEEGENGSTKTN